MTASRGLRGVIVWLAYALVTLSLQFYAGGYQHDSSTDADEPAHFVSGLMVRDYLVDGLPASPVPYAREYFSHYPKVAIGNWPPWFYAIEGMWMAVFPATLHSVLVLLGLMATSIAWMVYWLLRQSLPSHYAVFGGLAFLALQPVSAFFSQVMAEIPLTAMSTLAVCLWLQFLRTERMRELLFFGVAAVLTVLTKGNGLFVFLLLPFTVLIGGQWRLLRIPALWKLIVAISMLTVPWIVIFLPRMRSGWPAPDQWFRGVDTLWFYPRIIALTLGPVVVAFGLLGLWAQLRRRARLSSTEGLPWLAAGAALASVIAFHMAVPGGLFALRHVIPAYPFIAMFLAAGCFTAAEWLSRRGEAARRVSSFAAFALVGAALLVRLGDYKISHFDGFGRAARVIMADTLSGTPPRTMAVSDANGEGALIAQIGIADPHRPQYVVWRSSKLLASSAWSGANYVPRTSTMPGLLSLLDSAGVSTILVDDTARKLPHMQMMEQAISTFPDRFVLIATLPIRRGRRLLPEGLHLYRFVRDCTATGVGSLRQVPGKPGVEVAVSHR